MTDRLLTSTEQLDSAASDITNSVQAGRTSQEQSISKLQGLSFATGAWEAVGEFVRGIVDDVSSRLPDDVESVLRSYASGMTNLNQVTTDADQSLQVEAAKSNTAGSGTSPGTVPKPITGEGLTHLKAQGAPPFGAAG